MILGLAFALHACGGKSDASSRTSVDHPRDAAVIDASIDDDATIVDAGVVEDGSGLDSDADATPDEPLPDSPAPPFKRLTSMQGEIVDLSLDGTNVYWLTSVAAVSRIPKGGGRREEIVSPTSGPDPEIGGIVVRENWLYWASSTRTGLWRVGLGSSNIQGVGEVQPGARDLAAGSNELLFATSGMVQRVPYSTLRAELVRRVGGNLVKIAVLGDATCWTQDNGFVQCASLTEGDSGVPHQLSRDESNPYDITAVGTQVWWTIGGAETDCAGAVRKSELASAAPETVWSPSCPGQCQKPKLITATIVSVFWSFEERGCPIMHYDLATGTAQMLDVGNIAVTAIVVDSDSLYWGTSDGDVFTKDGTQ